MNIQEAYKVNESDLSEYAKARKAQERIVSAERTIREIEAERKELRRDEYEKAKRIQKRNSTTVQREHATGHLRMLKQYLENRGTFTVTRKEHSYMTMRDGFKMHKETAKTYTVTGINLEKLHLYITDADGKEFYLSSSTLRHDYTADVPVYERLTVPKTIPMMEFSARSREDYQPGIIYLQESPRSKY